MHHSRRKSGHGSSTDVRKIVTVSDVSSATRHHSSKSSSSSSSRPAAMTRKTTSHKLGKSPRDREREWEEDRWWEDERESFPQYCMSCEKQFVPQDDRFLYCSEACRVHDQNHTSANASASAPFSRPVYASPPTASYPFYSAGNPEPRDIIPRASPSRPGSMHYSPPSTPGTANHSAAISALRSLSMRDASPPSPAVTGTYHPNIWPFTTTSTSTRSPTASPSTSYSRPTPTVFSSTYDSAYYTAGYGIQSALERPLPSRRPGAYSRPKSIELVTPMIGR